MAGKHWTRSLSARPVHPFPANYAVSDADELRRAGFEYHVHAPRPVEYAAASFESAKRSRVLRGSAGVGSASLGRYARRYAAANGLRVRIGSSTKAVGA